MIGRTKKAETPAGGHQSGALSKGTEQAPFTVKTTTTPPKIKGFIVDCVLTLAAVPAVLLLLPLLFILAVGTLVGRASS